jgi:hypothetical protein
MALDRPDVKVRLDHDKHDALKVFARLDGLTITEYCERVINENLAKRIDDVNVAHAELARLGIPGNRRATPGKP